MTLARLADLYGVATSYSPSPGRTVPASDDAVVAALAALDVDASTPDAVRDALAARERALAERLLPPTVVLWQGDGAEGGAGAEERRGPFADLPPRTRIDLRTERRETLTWHAPEPPPPLPLGAHRLRATTPEGTTAEAHLVVAPRRAPGPRGRSYGFLVQLYSLLSGRSWGMGDLGDLAELATWAGRAVGAGFLQVNPLHAAVPAPPGGSSDPSPYRPSSRRFPDPVHLRVEAVPESAYLRGADRERAGEIAGRADALRRSVLAEDALIDRDAVWELKAAALEAVARLPLGPGRRAAYSAFLAEHGEALEAHATWYALAERHGPDWRAWPAPLRDPASRETARARTELMDRVDLYERLAWYVDEQLATAQRAARDAGMDIGLVHDLAVGVHPHGADSWAQQRYFAARMSAGAPPDAFNAHGQDWGLPPWRPDRLAASGYAPFRDLLRATLRHAGAVRIDHVMGLFRLWWVPEGRRPTEGTYVRYDAEAMLAVLVLEAHRAGALVIGEDLGTVEPGVREALRERGILGTSVLWFERDWHGAASGPDAEAEGGAEAQEGAEEGEGEGEEGEDGEEGAAGTGARDGGPLPPEAWRADCLATATTHDLPSTAARVTGEHVRLRHELGLLTRPLAAERAEADADVREWLALISRLGLLPGGAGREEDEVRAVHRFLLATPARLVGIWLPDTVGDRRPQNVPGTWDQYPNWRLPVADAKGRPVSLEELTASPRLHALLDVFRACRAGRTTDRGGAATP
ncbi:4-alpha-glucanotransferase [Streptomyces longispororuber]|uniref:4-alpha-glucanotransferase n=1 Tax=Streptomyces longispororuber TaxID=68230 RepID=UPI0036F886E1